MSDTQRDEQTLERLLKLAGGSEPISKDIEDRVYRKVHEEWLAAASRPDGERVYREVRREWNRTSARSRAKRWAVPVALAAAAVLALGIALRTPPPVATPQPIGTVVRVAGEQGALPTVGSGVFVGDTLTTGADNGMSVRLANAQSLRLDRATTVVVEGAQQFRLVAGRTYADTGDHVYRGKGLIIETSMGTVTDVGTQFAVDAGDAHLVVAVREGRVDVQRGDADELVAVAGERLRIAEGQDAIIDEVAPHDAYWDWVSELAPAYDIENRSLLEFLKWAARETGRELVFADDDLRMAAMRTDLHGSVEDVGPDDALGAVLATTDFRYRIEPDRIIILRD